MSSPINTSLSLADCLEAAQIREPSVVRQFCGGHFVSPDELAQMREWLIDCAISECRTEEDACENVATVAAMDDRAVLRYVSKHYSGGIPAFIQAGPVEA